MFFLSPKAIFLNEPKKEPKLFYSEYKSETKKFQYNTIIKDEDNSVSIHTLVSWYDPITKKQKQREKYKLYILDGEKI